MRHRVKKIKIAWGKDSNKMIIRKMAWNFIKYGKIKTTKARAKVLKSFLDRIVYKAIKDKPGGENILLKQLGSVEAVKLLKEKVAGKFKERIGGYVRLVRLPRRSSDSSEMARLEWVEDSSEEKTKEKREDSDKVKKS